MKITWYCSAMLAVSVAAGLWCSAQAGGGNAMLACIFYWLWKRINLKLLSWENIPSLLWSAVIHHGAYCKTCLLGAGVLFRRKQSVEQNYNPCCVCQFLICLRCDHSCRKGAAAIWIDYITLLCCALKFMSMLCKDIDRYSLRWCLNQKGKGWNN